MESKINKLSYLTHVDAIRAFAVLLVIFFHLEVEIFSGGFIGVDVFFVISGFLITRLLAHEYAETGTISFKQFYARRMRRLMPTLFLTIFLTFILTFLAFSPSDFMNATNSMLMSSIALSNFHFLGESDYFDIFSNFKPLLHTWSLGIEEQFYLLFPITLFLLLTLFRKRKNGILITLIILALLSFFYTHYSSKSGFFSDLSAFFNREEENALETSSIQFYLLPFRMFEFLIGGIIALVKVPKIKSEYLKLAIHAFGLILVVAFGILMSKNTAGLSTLNIIPCLGVGLLLYAPPAKFLSFIYDNKFLRYTGKISYTLYLMHWLVIVMYRYVFDVDFSALEQIGMFITMFLLSSVIYEFYEKPLRYTKAKFSIKSDRSLVYLFIIGVLLINTIQLKVNSEDGWLWRLSDENLALIEKIGVPKDYHLNNWGGAGYKPGWLGEQPKEGTSPDMIWIGDSHTGHYQYGLDTIMVKKHKKHILIANLFPSQLHLPEVTRTNTDKAVDLLTEHLAVIKQYPNSVIVISYSWIAQMSGSSYLNDTSAQYEKFPVGLVSWKILAQKIEKFHQLIGKSRKLMVIGDTPRFDSKELNYIEKLSKPKYLALITSPPATTFINNRTEFNQYFEAYFDAKKEIQFIDPNQAICKDGNCVKQLGAKIYFSDNNHLTKDGSLLVVEYLEKVFLDAISENKRKK